MKRCVITAVAAVMVLSMVPADVEGLINPNFTPINLVEQSGLIAEVTFEKIGDEKGLSTAAVTSVIKGKSKQKKYTFDFNATAYKEQGKTIAAQLKQLKDTPVLLFIGSFSEEGAGMEGGGMMPPGGGFGDEGGAEEGEKKGYLHVNGQWVVLFPGEKNTWEMDEISQVMLGTWNGSTGMLKKVVKYILADPDPDVPVKTFAQWSIKVKAGTVKGNTPGAASVMLKKGTPELVFVACEQGDRLYSYDPIKETFTDIAAKHGIKTCSKAFQWADANRDGLTDLASWDGSSLNLLTQKKDGTFESKKIKTEGTRQGCLDISPTDAGKPGSIGLVLSTAGSPVLVVCGKESSSRMLVTGPFPGAGLGKAGRCIVADFDNDSVPDIVQPFETGSLFYKGTKLGEFAQPSKCSVALGEGKTFSNIGDFDHDGSFDIFVTGEYMNRMWRNDGKAGFTDVFGYTGELAYISKPGGVYTETCDINSDGRQDVYIIYAQIAPHHFFNRGYHSFGHSHMMDLAENELLPQASEGARTGCMGDFNADGAHDAVMILNNGEIWVFFRETVEEFALCVHATISPDSAFAGPLKVTGWNEGRCLGSWNIYAGSPPAFFARRTAGTCKVKWMLPGGTACEKEVILESKPAEVIISK